jgi:hypothetical protein
MYGTGAAAPAAVELITRAPEASAASNFLAEVITVTPFRLTVYAILG